MLKHNLVNKSLIAATMVACAVSVSAQQTSTGSATVTVQNAFTLTKDADLDFGTLRATQVLSSASITLGAGIKILADGTGSTNLTSTGTATGDKSVVTVITGGSPAEFSITNAAASTVLTITVPSATTLNKVSDSTPVFDLTFGATDVRVVNSDTTEVAYNGNNLTTDATGNVGFKLGGSLRIINDIDDTISEESYIGTFDVVVDY